MRTNSSLPVINQPTTRPLAQGVDTQARAATLSQPMFRGFAAVLFSLIGFVLLGVIGATGAWAQSVSAVIHQIDGNRVVCESGIQADVYTVTCQVGGTTHLVIQQVGNELVAYPKSNLGRRINDQAFRLRVGQSAG